MGVIKLFCGSTVGEKKFLPFCFTFQSRIPHMFPLLFLFSFSFALSEFRFPVWGFHDHRAYIYFLYQARYSDIIERSHSVDFFDNAHTFCPPLLFIFLRYFEPKFYFKAKSTHFFSLSLPFSHSILARGAIAIDTTNRSAGWRGTFEDYFWQTIFRRFPSLFIYLLFFFSFYVLN